MTQFWINIILAILVTMATVIADWIANQLILLRRRLLNIRIVIDKAIADSDRIVNIREEVNKFYNAQESFLLWGSNLAAISFSLDLSILGIWLSNPAFFPFFSRWNDPNIQREIPIWLIIIFSHFCLLLLSIILKHKHNASIDLSNIYSPIRIWQLQWYRNNIYLIICNLIGFISLFTSFIIITNSI